MLKEYLRLISMKWSVFAKDGFRFLLSVSITLAVGLTIFALPARAAAGIHSQMFFQGKVVNKTIGTNVTNGSFSFTFSIYSLSSGGSAIWTETKSLTVTDGIFTTYLGDTTPLPGSVDFNSDTLYLGVEFNSNGEMTPRIRLSAVPYAFNAAKVSGLSVTNTTGTLTIGNGKTINFADAFTTSGANPLTLTSTGTTSITLPTTGTLMTLLGAETLTNKTIGSTGLVFSGASTDITTVGNESIVLDAAGTGATTFNDTTTIGAGSPLIITGGAGNPTVTNGTLWYDTTANKFKVVENGAVKILCNTTDLGCSSAVAISSLTAATQTNSINNANFGQTWNWNSATTQTGLTLTGSALTSGTALAVQSSVASNFTGSLASINLSDGTGSSSNTGSVLTVTNAGTANNNTALTVQNNGTGTNALSLRVNDEANDTTPTVIDQYGRMGIGSSSPQTLLQVGSATNNGDLVSYGEINKQSLSRSYSLGNIIDVSIYDTQKDSDGGAWTWKTMTAPWATETKDDGPADPCVIATDDRCGQNMFPERAILVTTPSGLYIFNAEDNSLWMKFTQDGTYSLGADSNNNPSGVTALNGVVYVGTNGSSGTGLYAFDFVNNQIYRYNSTNRISATTGIETRNTAVSYTANAQTTVAIADSIVNDVSATIVTGSFSGSPNNGVLMVGVATDTALSVIHVSSGQTFSYSDVTGNDYNAIYLTRGGKMFALNETLGQLERWNGIDNDQVSEINGVVPKVWDEGPAGVPPLSKTAPTIPLSPSALDVVEGGSYALNTDDIVYVATNLGLTEIQDGTNSWSRFINTTRQTAFMPGTIRGMFGFDENNASVDAVDYSMRNNVLQVMGNPSYSQDSGIRGKYVTLDGVSPTKYCSDSNNDGTCDVDTDFNPGTLPFSISFWMKKDSNPANPQIIIDKVFTTAAASDTGGYRILMATDGSLTFQIDDDASIFNDDQATSSISYADGQWHHVFALKNTTAIELYVDGLLVGQDTSLVATGTLGTAGIFTVGAQCSGATNCTTGSAFYEGAIDELRVSMGGTGTADVITAAQVNQMYMVDKAHLSEREALIVNFPGNTFSSTAVGNTFVSWIPNEFAGAIVELTSGTGAGQTRRIVSNTAKSITVSPAWGTTPDLTTWFVVRAEALVGSTDSVSTVSVEKSQLFNQGYKVFVGTNDGADGGALTVLNEALMKTDTYHKDAVKTDSSGAAWTGTGSNNIRAVSATKNAFIVANDLFQWSDATPLSLSSIRSRFDKLVEQFRSETLRDTLTGLGLEIGTMGGADLAEYYDSNQQLRAGDIVGLVGSGSPQSIQRTTRAYDSAAIGVVATEPGMILGPKTEYSYPIALVGRVPVNVTTEGGVISAGDLITPSSSAGYGMVAQVGGISIGKALQDLPLESFGECPDALGVKPSVKCGQVMVFVNLSQSLGVPVSAMINRNPIPTIQGMGDVVFPDLAQSQQKADDRRQSMITQMKNLLVNRTSEATASRSAQQNTLRIDRVEANHELAAPDVIAERVIARSIQAENIEGLELLTNKLETLSQDAATQLQQLRDASASVIPDVGTSSAHISLPPVFLTPDQLEVTGLRVAEKATFKSETFFEQAVEFAASVIFKNDIELEGLTYLAEDSLGEVIVAPGQTEVTVQFQKPYEVAPVVSVTMNIDWSKLEPQTQELVKNALEQGRLQYFVIDRSPDHFTLRLREPIAAPMTFTWTAWPAEKKDIRTINTPLEY